MSSAADKIRKRAFFPVTINGEQVHVREMRESERVIVTAFSADDASIGYLIGCCLLNEDKSQAFTPTADETPQQFGDRVLKDLDPPRSVMEEFVEAVQKLAIKETTRDTLEKN